MKKFDVILLCGVLALVILIVFFVFLFREDGNTVVITVDGKEYARRSLSEDCELWIEGFGGGRNLLIIQDGSASIREASCPDHRCVHMGKASTVKDVVCLPNRVIVSIE